MGVVDLFFGRRIRQNHALEHATVTILSEKVANLRLSARSSPRGFIIFGPVDLEKVREAAAEALERLQAGEAELAIHPNCGTNVAVGLIVTVLSWTLALALPRSRSRWFSAAAGTLGAALIARPFGTVVQRHVTTLPDLRGVRVREIERRSYFGLSTVEVQTTQGQARLPDKSGRQ
ncbi:MAG TPA: DUF6391 domain-containing protein [Ktedonobacterales bacterium]|nr:DUF6391 domain-containing protein [Ktedonobacterales bacterium]